MISAHLEALLQQWRLPTEALNFIRNKTPQWMIGADEVGYGAIAGPYAVGAFLCPLEWSLAGVKDSKKIKEIAKREVAYGNISRAVGTAFTVKMASNRRIDTENKHAVLHDLFHRAVLHLLLQASLDPQKVFIVLDGEARIPLQHFAVVKADKNIQAVSAASIMAKVTRDRWMLQQHEEWPVYGWDTNMGYDTEEHRSGLTQHGYCEIHRTSYEPIASMVRKAHENLLGRTDSGC